MRRGRHGENKLLELFSHKFFKFSVERGISQGGEVVIHMLDGLGGCSRVVFGYLENKHNVSEDNKSKHYRQLENKNFIS